MEIEPEYGYVPKGGLDTSTPPGHVPKMDNPPRPPQRPPKPKLKYRFFDMDLIDPLQRAISEREIELMGGEGWEIIKITDAIKIGKNHFIRIFVKKQE